jgi:hypothetical protein
MLCEEKRERQQGGCVSARLLAVQLVDDCSISLSVGH